jgi:hypothetical protein
VALEEQQVIDGVRKTEDGKIVLVISDTGKVANPQERVSNLVHKLKSYINSIMAGDIKRDYPEKTAQDFVIEVECRREPTPEMRSITRVMPAKDPANMVHVRFVESVKGTWGPVATGVKQDGSPAQKKTGEVDEHLDDLSNAVLTRAALVAGKYLDEEEKGFYFAVLGWDEDKTDVIYFREDSVTDAVKREVDQYVRDLTMAFTVCVLVSVGTLKKYRKGEHEAVLLELHRRGRQMARVYARRIRRKGVFLKHNETDAMELVGSKTGLFPF